MLQIKRMMKINATDSRAAMIYTPNDIATNTAPCGLIYFAHGVGEAGNGTLSTVDSLLNNGSPLYVASQQEMTFTNPVTGATQRFIVVGLQGTSGWTVVYSDVYYALTNDIMKTYNIDPNAIFFTGLSAGGQETWQAITNSPTAPLFAAAVPLSPSQVNTASPTFDYANVVNNKINVWGFHGNQDSGQTDEYNSIRYVAGVDAIKTGYTRLTMYNGGHCCWGTYYAPTYKESLAYFINNVAQPAKSMNIYEFMLAAKKGQGFTFNNSVTPPPLPTATKAVVKVQSISGKRVTFDGTGSISKNNIGIGSWWFADNVNSPTKNQIYWQDGRTDGGGEPGPNMKYGDFQKNGTYLLDFTVNDKSGGRDTTTIQVDYNVTPTPTVPPCSTNSVPTFTQTQASLSWSVSTGATSYDLYMNGALVASNLTVPSYNATGLTPATKYTWYVVPKNSVGSATGCTGNATSFTTLSNVTPPTLQQTITTVTQIFSDGTSNTVTTVTKP